MQFDEALKILGLELGRGDKVKVNPFKEAFQANEVWRESSSWLGRASTPGKMEHRSEIKQANWQIVLAWGTLVKFYCNVCGYVVSPDRYHRHCPDCKRLLSRKEFPLESVLTGVIETCPRCGEVEVSIID